MARQPLIPIGLLLAVVSFLAPACNTANLQFVQDHRLHFSFPKAEEKVRLPLKVTWTITDFAIEAPGSVPPNPRGGFFALFVDRAPVRPGQTVRALADRTCQLTPGCPDASYLAERGVYTTTAIDYTLSQVPPLNNSDKVQLHEVTIVLMDSAGRRIDESAWQVDFRLQEPTT